MRNRILAFFLALCLGVSLIPCVWAAPAEGLCLGSTSEANISPSGSGTILLPSPVCSVRSVVAGASVTLECLAQEFPESGGVRIPASEHSAEIRYTCIICGATEVRSCHVCPGKLFADVPGEENWAHRGIDFCLWEGLMVGVDAAHFCPNDQVTREQLAAFVCRFARFQGRDVTARASLSAFPDGDSVSSFAQASMSWAVSTGLISGVGDGNGGSFLQPKSRAQAAAILMRYCTEP